MIAILPTIKLIAAAAGIAGETVVIETAVEALATVTKAPTAAKVLMRVGAIGMSAAIADKVGEGMVELVDGWSHPKAMIKELGSTVKAVCWVDKDGNSKVVELADDDPAIKEAEERLAYLRSKGLI